MKGYQFILIVVLAIAAAIAIGIAVAWYLRRRIRPGHSKYGFAPEGASAQSAQQAVADSLKDVRLVHLEKFTKDRGDQIADVLVDYAKAKGLRAGAYFARPHPHLCIWWLGEKFPALQGDVLAVVHVDADATSDVHPKVVVLRDISEADELGRALCRVARRRKPATKFDGWGVPISFPGFPLKSDDKVEICELTASLPQRT